MNFALSDEQQMLQKSASDFVRRESSLKRIRELRNDSAGFSQELYAKMAELGWLGMAFPESAGGLGQGLVEMAVVMEELGKGLMPEPVLSSVLLGGQAILLGGTADQQRQWLPKISEGGAIVTLAYLERQSRYDPFDVMTQASRDGAGWRLGGEKTYVPDAGAASGIVVAARTRGGRRDREGVEMFIIDLNTLQEARSSITTPRTRNGHLTQPDTFTTHETRDSLTGENLMGTEAP